MTDPSSTFAPFLRAYETRWSPAARRPILGYLDAGFPEEIAIAAGFHPLLLTADPSAPRIETRDRLDLSTPGRVAQLFEGLATGRYGFVDLLVVTGGDRFVSNTYGFLDAERERTGRLPVAAMLYMERAHGTYREHRDFNQRQFEKLAIRLGALSGQPVTQPRLAEAIHLVNRARALVARFDALRAQRPGLVSAWDAALIGLGAHLMDKTDFIAALDAHLAALAALDGAVPDRLRVVLCGSDLDHPLIHAALDAAGVALLGETVALTGGYGFDPVREDIPAMDALADLSTYRFPAPWMWGRDRRIRLTRDRAGAARPDRVLYLHRKYDAGIGWDYPDLRDALQAQGIAVRLIHDMPYDIPSPAAMQRAIAEALA